MALKRRASSSEGEQLYMLEVFIDQLFLNPEVTDASGENLIFYVKFIDLPVYEIRVPKNDEAAKHGSQGIEDSTDHKFGKSCLFTKKPSYLVKAIRWSYLSIEMYDKDATGLRKRRAPIGTAKVSFPACMCNQVIEAQKEIDGIATPCTVKDTFNLDDSHGKVTGSVTLVLRLSCFGNPIVEHFALSGKSFMLDDSPMQKFLCSYVDKDKGTSNGKVDSNRSSLKRPHSPPRISMDDPIFETLTTAEKLNDPKYRELIYNTYPNEPTCCCSPKDRSTHPMQCQSGCTRSCCMKLRNPNILSMQTDENGQERIDDTYCVNNYVPACHTSQQEDFCNGAPRLRGGGDIEQLYVDPAGYKWVDYDPDYAWYDDRHNYETRLEGGGNGEKDMTSCSCSGSPVMVSPTKSSSQDRNVVSVFDACTPRMTSTGPKPGCVCPGKETSMLRGAAKCMKKPCQGIDCLIRAFKDAQDFVDSIGRVPGLPGLGLMDPSESPYFGRDIDRDYVPNEPPVEKKKTPAGSPPAMATTPVCTAPCGMQAPKPIDGQTPFGPQVPRGLTVPPRLGIVREAIPVLPDAGSTIAPAKHRKKEDKKDEKTDKQKDGDGTSSMLDAEVGPCGEPKCKSRRKTPTDNVSQTHSVTSTSSRVRIGMKRAPNQKARRKGKPTKESANVATNVRATSFRETNVRSTNVQATSGRKTNGRGAKKRNTKALSAGPGGDRDIIQSNVVPSKRVMRYVYFCGDYYPGINFGHRNCIDIRMRVPANMGWLWNTMTTPGNLKPRIGWRPGAIGRYLYELLQDAKENSMSMEEPERGRGGKIGRGTDRGRAGVDRGRRMGLERARSAPSRHKSLGRRSRTGRTMSYQGMQKQSKMEGEEQDVESPPTLHIHRKDGTYYVTMYPIRQSTSKEPRLTEPMKPLQFKIVKNKEDVSDASSSTASDMEIEFSPPAAVSRYRKKPDVIHVDTQVRQQEILDAYKEQELKKKGRRSRGREKKKPSKVSIQK